MPRIPTFNYTPQSSGPQQVRADPGMYDPVHNATARIGQATAQIGEVLGAAAVQMQKAENYKVETEMDIGLQEEWDDFQNNLNPATDETKWREEWQKKVDARIAKMTPKNAGPVLRQNLELKGRAFKVRTSGDITQQAKALGVQKARTIGETRTNQLWRNGDVEGAQSNLQQMAERGLILPEQIPSMMQAGKVNMQKDSALRLINTNPIEAEEVLTERTEGGRPKNFPDLDEHDRYSLVTQAERNASQLRAQSYQSLVERMNGGELVQQQELEGMVEQKLLTATQAQALMRQQKSGKLEVDTFAQLRVDAINYDPAKDSTQTEFAKIYARTLALPADARSAVIQALKDKADPKSPMNSPAARDLLQRAESEYRDGLFLPWADVTRTEGGFFGIGGTEKTERVQPGQEDLKSWKDGTIKKEVRDAANIAYATYLSKIRGFIEQNPKATDMQLEEYSQALKRPYVIASVSAAISAQNQPTLTPADKQALEWANQNPTDPRAVKIKQRLGQ